MVNTSKQKENLFRKLAEKNHAGILVLSQEKIKYINPTANKISGYSRQELFQMNFLDRVHSGHRNLAYTTVLEVLNGEKLDHRQEYAIITKKGETRWVIVASELIDRKTTKRYYVL